MKLNASKTKTMIVSMSPAMHPKSSPLTIIGTVLKDYIFGVRFDSNMTFENHLRSISRACSFSKTWYLEEVLENIP